MLISSLTTNCREVEEGPKMTRRALDPGFCRIKSAKSSGEKVGQIPSKSCRSDRPNKNAFDTSRVLFSITSDCGGSERGGIRQNCVPFEDDFGASRTRIRFRSNWRVNKFA